MVRNIIFMVFYTFISFIVPINKCKKLQSLGMNTTNKVDFSNVFSARSQSILAKGHLIISQLSKTKKITSKQPSTPKSPIFKKKQFMTNIPKAQTYRQNSKIVLTGDRIRQISGRLDIDATTVRQLEKRLRTDKLYFKDDDNPFTREFISKKQRSPKRSLEKNLFTEMARMRQNTFEKMSRRLNHMVSPAKEIIMKMQKQRIKSSITWKQIKNKSIDKLVKHIEQRHQRIKDEFKQLDELIQRKQQNYFEKLYHSQPKNIFLLINDRNHPDFRSNRQILNSLDFSLDSMVSRQQQKFTSNILEQISSYSRLTVKGITSIKMPQTMALKSNDLNLDTDMLSFSEIMLIPTGKLVSSVLLKYFREDEEDTKKKQLPNEDESSIQNKRSHTHYLDNTMNKRVNFNAVDQMKTQTEYYGRSQYTAVQRQQQKKSKTFQNSLNKMFQEELLLISNAIRDKKLMRKFQEEKNGTLQDLLNNKADKHIAKITKEVQKKIRMNKIDKNRTQKIKIDMLTQSCKINKNMQRYKDKSSSKESRYSPFEIWRG